MYEKWMSVDIASLMLTWKKMVGWDFCLEFNSWLVSIWNDMQSSYVTVDLLPLENHRSDIGVTILNALEMKSNAWDFWWDVGED